MSAIKYRNVAQYLNIVVHMYINEERERQNTYIYKYISFVICFIFVRFV